MNRYNNEYAKQARAFLEKTGARLEMVYLGRKKHFPSDTEARDMYSVSLVRGDKSFTFDFGDSIKNTEDNRSSGLRNKPSAYDILACLTSNEPSDDIDSFAAEYGIEKPSEAFRVFEAVKRESAALRDMFNEQELSELQEIV